MCSVIAENMVSKSHVYIAMRYNSDDISSLGSAKIELETHR